MKRFSMMLAAAGTTLALTAPPAVAEVLFMQLKDLTGGTTVACDNTLVSGCPAGFLGTNNGTLLTFSGGIGPSWTSNLTAGSSNSPGTPSIARIDVTQLVLTNTSGATRNFQILLTGFGFTTPPGDPLSFFGSASTSSTGVSGTVQSLSYFDPANTGALLNQITCSFVPSTNNSCAEPAITVSNGGGAYSLTQILNITGLGAGQSINLTANQSVRGVPEPGTLVLAGGALLMAAGASRRKRGQ